MNAFKMRLFRFTRTAYVCDLMADAQAQQIAAIRRKAARFETLRHTAGTISAFNVY